MIEILAKVRQLKSKLSNPGEEVSITEVGWNDSIYEEIEETLAEVHPGITQQIRLNHL